jgi:hypothetical protein
MIAIQKSSSPTRGKTIAACVPKIGQLSGKRIGKYLNLRQEITDWGCSKEKPSQINIGSRANNPSNLKDLCHHWRFGWQQTWLMPPGEPAIIFSGGAG